MRASLLVRWVARAALAMHERERLLLAKALIASPLEPEAASVLRQVGELAIRRSSDLYDTELNKLLQREGSHDHANPRGDDPR